MDQLEKRLLAQIARDISVMGRHSDERLKELLEMADRVEYGDKYWEHVYGGCAITSKTAREEI